MHNIFSTLQMQSNTSLNIYQNLNLGQGSIIFENNTTLGKASGKEIIGSIAPQGVVNNVNI